ncbi:hypothetical protein [Pseudoalteromonas sp. MMG022]|uniref:hypothetical protein n=1 Tax=Pseudoalteromonas sp. MMG022 TaxID=2909978 RepID=UPI001F382C39|nr:hypothetical protein [Pseudoalteromonas sp. MMG022]MCF6436993.1 hypothetical protein [Pseudoalteromonas sp. MMG022]
MSSNLKNARFCTQYSQLFEHKVQAKQAQLNDIASQLTQAKTQLQDCYNKLNSANEHYFLAIAMPEVHRATLNHVAHLSNNINELISHIDELEAQQKAVEQDLKLLKLKQRVTDNKSDKFKSLENMRLKQIREKQLEQLWVINKGNSHHA